MPVRGIPLMSSGKSGSLLRYRFGCCLAGVLHGNGGFFAALFGVFHRNLGALFGSVIRGCAGVGTEQTISAVPQARATPTTAIQNFFITYLPGPLGRQMLENSSFLRSPPALQKYRHMRTLVSYQEGMLRITNTTFPASQRSLALMLVCVPSEPPNLLSHRSCIP